MYNRNNGSTEQEILQNHFTAFVTKAIDNARIDYLRKEYSRARNTYDISEEKFLLIPDNSDFTEKLGQSEELSNALITLDERERYVLFARVLDELSFEEIGDRLNLKYKGVSAIYYRAIAKLRDILKGE